MNTIETLEAAIKEAHTQMVEAHMRGHAATAKMHSLNKADLIADLEKVLTD